MCIDRLLYTPIEGHEQYCIALIYSLFDRPMLVASFSLRAIKMKGNLWSTLLTTLFL